MSKLRNGYTTGTCASAVARAGAQMLISGNIVDKVNVILPNGTNLSLDIENIKIDEDCVICSVKKDSGDDPDITNGVDVFAKVSMCDSGINITGGKGIGVVTKAGLNQPIGEYAINSTPRKAIKENVADVCEILGYSGGINVEISIPKGVELAKKTFNPRLGIVGGISVLGTTGIVEPMSEKALVDTIRTELNVVLQNYDYAVGVFGNYGAEFAINSLGINKEQIFTMSNFVGDSIDIARDKGFKGLLIIGHIGKMIKLGAGITNTHSKFGDARMEIMASCGIEAGVDYEILKAILKCNTTDEAVELLTKNDIINSVMDRLIARIDYYTKLKADNMDIGAIVFSNKYGVLCSSDIDIERYK